MLAVFFLTSVLAPPGDVPVKVAERIAEAQAAYRDCIADTIAARPQVENNDLALAAALGQCREAELALRAQTSAAPGASAADTLAIVLDTRMDGEEAGLARRKSR